MRTLTLFKMAANTLRKQSAMSFLWKNYKNMTVFSPNFKGIYRDKCKKINCWKAIGEKFDLIPEHEFSVFPVVLYVEKHLKHYKKTRLK